MDVAFVCQPPNSPDLNTEDLAFFRGIQSLQFQENAYMIDQLMVNVMEAFHEFPRKICKKVWTTAQMVMNEILICGGDNNYKLSHADKDKIVRAMKHDIPLRLSCQAMINNGSLNGEAIISFAKTLPPLNNSVVALPPLNNYVASSFDAASSALLLLAGTVSDNAVAMEEGIVGTADDVMEEGIVGTADDVVIEQEYCAEDKEACVTPYQREFWEDFENKKAWGREEYENHTEGLIERADLEEESEVLAVEEPIESVVATIENEDRWAFEA